MFLTNSGTEANEAAFKLARRNGGTDRPRILALEGSFHGRSMGALALTHKAAYREPFEPLPGGVEFVPFADTDALEAAFAVDGDKVAALFLEPLQGEAGVRPLPPGYLALARKLTAEHGALLILDEVQTGMGRTGAWFAHQHPHIGGGIVPDAVTVAKGLGGGFPVGALIAYGERTATLLGRGQHGTTFGGNPVASAAGLATIARHRARRPARARRRARRARSASSSPAPATAGRRGARRGVSSSASSSPRRSPPRSPPVRSTPGFIVNPCTPTTIRLAPPFLLTAEQAGTFVDFLAGLPEDLS